MELHFQILDWTANYNQFQKENDIIAFNDFNICTTSSSRKILRAIVTQTIINHVIGILSIVTVSEMPCEAALYEILICIRIGSYE